MYGIGAEETLKRRVESAKIDYPEAEACIT